MAHPDVPGAAGYLNRASVGLPPTAVADAMHAAVEGRRGRRGRQTIADRVSVEALKSEIASP